MSATKKLVLLFLVISFILTGCAHIPKMESPLEREKVYHKSFDKTWNAVLEVIKTSNGVIISSDKPSGIITYVINDKVGEKKRKVFINVCLRTRSDADVTTVYLFPKFTGSFYLKEIEKEFFEKLSKNLGE